MNKKELRERMRKKTGINRKRDSQIINKVISLPEYDAAKSIFVYIGAGDEINTDYLVDDMLKKDKAVYVPLCLGKGEMVAKRISSRDELKEGMYGIPEPGAEALEIPPEDISLVIVPGVAFGRDFTRLGRGGGYYDRFLEKASGATLVAPCREENLLETVPVDEHDRSVDVIVTNEEVLRKDR